MKKIFYGLLALVSSYVSAQEGAGMTPFQYEKSTGYRGKISLR